MKIMEEQFPGFTVGRKWEQVAPGVAYSGCCDSCSDLGFRPRHSFFQLLAVLVADSFQHISPQELPSVSECHLDQGYTAPQGKGPVELPAEASGVTVSNLISPPSVHFYFLYPHLPTDVDPEGNRQ